MKELIPMLLDLGFPLPFQYKTHALNGYIDNPADVPDPTKEYREPSPSDVEKWLWEKHQLFISIRINEDRTYHYRILNTGNFKIISMPDYLNPIEAKTKSLESAIKYLHKKHKK